MRESDTTSGLSPIQAEITADTSINLDTSVTGGSNFQTIRQKEGDGSGSESDHEQDKPPPADYQGTEEDKEEQKRKALAKLLAQRQKETDKFNWQCAYEKAKRDLRAGKLDETISIVFRH